MTREAGPLTPSALPSRCREEVWRGGRSRRGALEEVSPRAPSAKTARKTTNAPAALACGMISELALWQAIPPRPWQSFRAAHQGSHASRLVRQASLNHHAWASRCNGVTRIGLPVGKIRSLAI